MDNFEFRHPVWIKFIGWIFLPLMLGGSLWFISIPVIYGRIEIIAFAACVPMGGFCLYMAINGLMTLKYMNVTLLVKAEGLELRNELDSKVYPWKSITKVNHVASAQVVHFYDLDGIRFLSITEQLKRYPQFISEFQEKTGLKV